MKNRQKNSPKTHKNTIPTSHDSQGFSGTIGIPLSNSDPLFLVFLTILFLLHIRSPFQNSQGNPRDKKKENNLTAVSPNWKSSPHFFVPAGRVLCAAITAFAEQSFCGWRKNVCAAAEICKLLLKLRGHMLFSHTRFYTQKDTNSQVGSEGSPQETLCVRLWAWCPAELWLGL